MKLQEKISTLRRRQGWSQEELAEHLGVSRQSVSKWESGASTPELERIVQMCSLFGLTADTLIRDDLDLDGEISAAGETAPRWPVMTLDDVFAYIAQCRTNAHKLALGVGACVRGAREIDDRMADARRALDWDGQWACAIDPETARTIRADRSPEHDDTCSMCGKFCAVRSMNKALAGEHIDIL